MVMYANEFETKEKQKLTEIKNKLQHIYEAAKVIYSYYKLDTASSTAM